jgi:hypothetical protein
MQKTINGVQIKLTKNNYVYKNGQKLSNMKVNPLQYPKEILLALSEQENKALSTMIDKSWSMVNG